MPEMKPDIICRTEDSGSQCNFFAGRSEFGILFAAIFAANI
jgi:hypothetical protein